jgi:hypothetical protein
VHADPTSFLWLIGALRHLVPFTFMRSEPLDYTACTMHGQLVCHVPFLKRWKTPKRCRYAEG